MSNVTIYLTSGDMEEHPNVDWGVDHGWLKIITFGAIKFYSQMVVERFTVERAKEDVEQ